MTAPDKIWASRTSTVYMDGSAPLTASTREFRNSVEYTRTASIPAPDTDYVAAIDDGRPCNTDVFLSAVLDQLEDKYDVHEALSDWVVGDWDKAMVGVILPRMALSVRHIDMLSEQLRDIVMSYDAANPMRLADFHGENCRCHRCHRCDIDRIRAIIGGQANG